MTKKKPRRSGKNGRRLSPAQLRQRSDNGKITYRRTVNPFLSLHYPDLDRAAQAITGWMRVTLPRKARGMTTAYLERWIQAEKWSPPCPTS